MTADPRPGVPARFRLAPVVDGVAAWDQATDVLVTPLRLEVDVITTPDAGLLLVTD